MIELAIDARQRAGARGAGGCARLGDHNHRHRHHQHLKRRPSRRWWISAPSGAARGGRASAQPFGHVRRRRRAGRAARRECHCAPPAAQIPQEPRRERRPLVSPVALNPSGQRDMQSLHPSIRCRQSALMRFGQARISLQASGARLRECVCLRKLARDPEDRRQDSLSGGAQVGTSAGGRVRLSLSFSLSLSLLSGELALVWCELSYGRREWTSGRASGRPEGASEARDQSFATIVTTEPLSDVQTAAAPDGADSRFAPAFIASSWRPCARNSTRAARVHQPPRLSVNFSMSHASACARRGNPLRGPPKEDSPPGV